MFHAAFEPAPELAPFVRSVWLQEEPAVPRNAPVPPTVLLPVGHATLVLEYGDPFEELDDDGRAHRLPPALLAGPFSRPVRVRALGATGLALVPFQPFGAAAFFPEAARFAERFVTLEELVPAPDVRELRERLLAANTPDARRVVVEGFLRARLAAGTTDPALIAAVTRIEHLGGREPIAGVAATLGLGRRRLARGFERGLGLAPKVFARIVRFQRALELAGGGASLGQVAARCGFADQAHLVHECQALGGRSPRALVGELESREVGRRFRGAGDGPFATYL